jgi:hypothetical protein
VKVRIVRDVPGLTHGRTLTAGETVDLPEGLAFSLVADGFAAPQGRARVGASEKAATEGAPETRGRHRKAVE